MTTEPLRAPAGITVDLFADSILTPSGQTAVLAVEAGGEVLGAVPSWIGPGAIPSWIGPNGQGRGLPDNEQARRSPGGPAHPR